jgi:Cyclin
LSSRDISVIIGSSLRPKSIPILLARRPTNLPVNKEDNMKKKPCRNIYDSCIEEDDTSANSVVECSPIINDTDVKSNQNEEEREDRPQRMTRSQAKRKLVQESASLQEKKKRRSVNDNCKRGSKTLKQNNVKEDVEKESSSQYVITPSPAIFPPTTSRIDNVKDIAIDLNPYEEFALQMNEKCQSTQSSGRRPELPSGVRSILCPYLKWCSLANSSYSGSDSKVQTRGMNALERHGSLFPCGCSFLYDDACGIINIESYLASYLDEYIESLKENEFNIGQVSRTIFPLYLRTASGDEFRKRMRKHDLSMFQRLFGAENNSSLSRCKESDKDQTSHPSTISTSLFARDRFRFYMDYFYRYERLDPKGLPVVTPNIRAVLVDWLIEVAAEYNLGSITLHTAVGLVDRCLASEKCELVKSSSSSDKWKKSSENTGNGAFLKKKKCLVVTRKTIQLLGW